MLGTLSSYLEHNPDIMIARQSFRLVNDSQQPVSITTEKCRKSFLANLVDDVDDMDSLWQILLDQNLLNVDVTLKQRLMSDDQQAIAHSMVKWAINPMITTLWHKVLMVNTVTLNIAEPIS